MNRVTTKFASAAIGTFWMIAGAAPALADDTEVFRYTSGPESRANILFIIDESRSMDGDINTQVAYTGATTYPSQGCDPARVYWKAGTGAPPRCDTPQWVDLTAVKCSRATQAFAATGTGRFWDDHMAQYDPTGGSGTGRWRDLAQDQKSRVVECHDDRPQLPGYAGHGDGGTPKYARDGAAPAPWGTSSGSQINWTSRAEATLYSANYINWYYGPTGVDPPTRLEVVKGAVDALLQDLEGVNVGLMRFNAYPADGNINGSQGGRVTVPVRPIETVRADIRASVAAMAATTSTPLAETLYEAGLYFGGKPPSFGTGSIATSRVTAAGPYDSPVDDACQKNFIVYLTDGEPTWDDDQDTRIKAMVDARGQTWSNLVGNGSNVIATRTESGSTTCDAEAWEAIDPLVFPEPPDNQVSYCLDDLAEFLYDGDISSVFDDVQNVRTITVGFALGVTTDGGAPRDLPVLQQAAERGNGRLPGNSAGVYFRANDAASLASAFDDIVGDIVEETASFASPTVSVNAFNRAENLSDLFVSVFQPSPDYHWPGNLKKYRLRDDGVIVDADNRDAVDPETGFFVEGTRSYWSAATDGPDVLLGGAANIIPASRTVFTNLAGDDLNADGNRIARTNTAVITDAVLGSGAPRATRNQVIDFINGLNPVTGQRRNQMGDPLHSQPVSVIYGPGLREGLLFVGTNDGYLHALDAATGIEQWAFIPEEFLDQQIDLLENDAFSGKHYAIDGPMRIQVEADADGIIESGEKVYLFFGMRRGGNFYYGLDISTRNDPQLMWRLDDSDLPGLGESWSAPVPTRVKINDEERLVLVIGGGYAPAQDNDLTTTDTSGNAIFIVDSVSGELLWHTGGTNEFAASDQTMNYSIPGDIKVIDMNGDRNMDRMYAADMGGQVWRFDVAPNPDDATNLAVGGVIARLGAATATTPTVALAENRRFYYSPDIAFVNTRTENFIHIGIGSGHREHPLGVVNSDRFFALRDGNIDHMTQDDFDDAPVITAGQLAPVVSTSTEITSAHKGWYINLLPGEKVLAEARTISNTVFFTTFRPDASVGTCQPQPGLNRIYRMSLYNGAPVTNLDGVVGPALTMSDLYVENQGSISSTSQVIFVSRDRDNDGIPDDQDTDDDNDGTADGSDTDADNDGIADDADPDDDNDGIPDVNESAGDQGWVCTDRICVPLGFTNAPVRTYWRQTSLD